MNMAKSNNYRQDRTATKPKNSGQEKPRWKVPVWGWALIVTGVILGGYLLMRNIGQQEPATSNLPAEISVTEAAKLEQQDWFFLDVREPSEWEEAHIPYATLIPLGELNSRLSEIPKDKNIVVVCRSGNRSAVGRDLLINSGFTNVTSMAGGMNTWQAKGFPVVTGP
ncbi:MAG: rhodanese-like domain-containing protein [Chloroflexota bacterium]|nr:rhodanese-like domain-containing protein [Chloroflexota bacterium]